MNSSLTGLQPILLSGSQSTKSKITLTALLQSGSQWYISPMRKESCRSCWAQGTTVLSSWITLERFYWKTDVIYLLFLWVAVKDFWNRTSLWLCSYICANKVLLPRISLGLYSLVTLNLWIQPISIHVSTWDQKHCFLRSLYFNSNLELLQHCLYLKQSFCP